MRVNNNFSTYFLDVVMSFATNKRAFTIIYYTRILFAVFNDFLHFAVVYIRRRLAFIESIKRRFSDDRIH